jgi:5'-nucleotidase
MEGEILPRDGVGGLARFTALLFALRDLEPERTLVVAAGDTFMPGPALGVRMEGVPAVALAHRDLPFDASALGNHEFDVGESFLDEMLGASAFPFLSATVSFDGGPLSARQVKVGDGKAPWAEESRGRVLSRAKRCVGRLEKDEEGTVCHGFVVGLVGATTDRLEQVASVIPEARSLPDLDAVVRAVQAEVDRLEAEGIDIVILLSHLQGAHRDLELIERGLRGVDVIVSGGGDDRLANPGDRLLPRDAPSPLCSRDEPTCYPLRRTARDGAPVLVIATDGQYRYIGRLGVEFDRRGRVRGVVPSSAPWPVDDRSLELLHATADGSARELEERLVKVLEPAREIVGFSRHWLNGEREQVRNRETNLGVLTADSLVHAARRRGLPADIGLRNGGSLRTSIGSREVSGKPVPIHRYDVEASLRFNDAVVVVQTTHRMLKETLEAGLRGVGTARGGFPHLDSNAFLVFDPERPEQLRAPDGGVLRPGERVRELRLLGKGGATVTIVSEGRLLDPDARIAIATLEYVARGGDGYFPADAGEISIAPLGGEEPLREREALVEYFRSEAWQEGRPYEDPPRKARLVVAGEGAVGAQ